MSNPIIARPIHMKINPKQRTPAPRLKRQSAVLMVPPFTPFQFFLSISFPMPRSLNRINIRKPRLTLLTPIFQKHKKARDAIPASHRPHMRRLWIGGAIPVMMEIKFLPSFVVHDLRDAEVGSAGEGRGTEEGLGAGEHALYGRGGEGQAGGLGGSFEGGALDAVYVDFGGCEFRFASFYERSIFCGCGEVVDVDEQRINRHNFSRVLAGFADESGRGCILPCLFLEEVPVCCCY